MKGQTTLEFIGSALFFILAVIGLLTLLSAEIPNFYDNTETAEKNLEAKYMSDYLLTSNTSSEPGLVNEYMHLDKNYIENDLGTVNDDSGNVEYNYTEMSQDLGLEYQYNIQITWYPVVQTHRTFTKGNPPTVGGEPVEEPSDANYASADNRIHYGSLEMENDEWMFLLASRDGEYQDLYINGNWKFGGVNSVSEGESKVLDNREFTVEAIQNRPDRPGASIVLSSEIVFADGRSYFGDAEEAAEGEVVKLNRYPMINDQGELGVTKMEVLAW